VKFLWDGCRGHRSRECVVQAPIQNRNVVTHEKTPFTRESEIAPFRSARYKHRSSRCCFVSTCLEMRLELIKIHQNQSPADFSRIPRHADPSESAAAYNRIVCGYGGCIVSPEIKARRIDNLRYGVKRMGAADGAGDGGGRGGEGGPRAGFAGEIKYYFPIKRYYLPLDGTRRIT
jgi:hypothetical protein